jgi:CubicO group peptidase (beta-lactamase class C family)
MKKIFTLILSLSVFYNTFSQKPTVKLSLQNVKDSIQKIVEKEKIVGLMVGITTKDSVLFSGGFGYSDLESKQKTDNKTLFRMGSNTKMFVGLAILKLQSEGKINLNDEIKKIAPEIKFENKWEATNPLKVVNLLEHTSGFDDMKLNAMYTLDKVEKWDLKTCNQASLVCRWRPSERHAYCNPNYNLLGYLIEKFSKKPYNQYIREQIMLPLGMNESNFNLYSKHTLDTKEYIVKNGKVEKVPQVTLIGGPQGALWSNADEMIRLLQMYLRNGQPIFDENIIKNMETARSGLGSKNGLKSGYGLGNYYTHFYNKVGMRGHSGLTGTCFSQCFYNREHGFGFVIANNSNYGGSQIEELISAFLEQNLRREPLNTQILDVEEMEKYVGFYQFDCSRNEIARLMDMFSIGQRFFIKNEDLYEQSFFGEEKLLYQVAPLTFVRKGLNTPTITFTKNEDGKQAMMLSDIYHEKGSYTWALIWRGLIILMIALIVISAIVAIGAFVAALIKKVAWNMLPKRFLPIFSFGIFVFAFSKVIEVQQFSYLLYELREVNARTLWVFLGTLFFGIAGLICLFLAIQSFRKNKNRWLAWYWMLTYGSVFGLAVLFFYFDYIGLKTWAM